MEPTGNSGKGGRVSRLMIARLNRVPNSAVFENKDNEIQTIAVPISNAYSAPTRRESLGYFEVQEEKDSFSDASARDLVDGDQKDNVENGMQKRWKKLSVMNYLKTKRAFFPTFFGRASTFSAHPFRLVRPRSSHSKST